jgi:hypothetical protein
MLFRKAEAATVEAGPLDGGLSAKLVEELAAKPDCKGRKQGDG